MSWPTRVTSSPTDSNKPVETFSRTFISTLYDTMIDISIDARIIYILMDYCGGGDLSTIIKQATKQNPTHTWRHHLALILQALHHCHHPNGHSRPGSGSMINGSPINAEGSSQWVQILHRDLKPDNGSSSSTPQTIVSLIFIRQHFSRETTQLNSGDFGLSKALAQMSFVSTYVGVRYC